MNFKAVRAQYDATTITVYQAFNASIADAALEAQRLVAPFSYQRMTWVKPSFWWMLERCGWATKPLQERVLAIRVHRADFEAALSQAVSTSRSTRATVRFQWDPERDARGRKLSARSLQLGLGHPVARDYATKWIARIDDLTPLVRRLHQLKREGELSRLERLAPVERAYPLSPTLAQVLGADRP
jgi:hypothetical protein